MRIEIKYKVWDKLKNLFIPNDVYALVQTDFGAFGIMLKDWEEYKEGEYFYYEYQHIIFSTGLKDKNGKEIYEGDIVTGYINLKKDEGSIITFKNGSFYWGEDPLCFDFDEHDGFIVNLPENWANVIGNIYENKL